MRYLGHDWFRRPAVQFALLCYANTAQGRADLALGDVTDPARSIIQVRPNGVTELAAQRSQTWPGACIESQRDHRTLGRAERRASFYTSPRIAYRVATLSHQGALVPRLLWAVHRWKQRGCYVPGFSPRFAWADTNATYPDEHPETNTWDGYCGLAGRNEPWAAIHDASSGNTHSASTSNKQNEISTTTTTDHFKEMHRVFNLHDTSGMGAGAVVSAATMQWHIEYFWDGLGITPAWNIYGATVASNTTSSVADYGTAGATAFATKIQQGAGTNGAYNTWTMNATGRAALDTDGISTLCYREANYDAPDSAPAWASNTLSHSRMRFSDYTGTSADPLLTSTYTPGTAGLGVGSLLLLGVG